PEARVPANHPLRKIRNLVRDVLGELNRSLTRLYASEGRPSIPPEQLLSALLLQVFYGIRSERQLMEQLDYNLLYRWFVGLSPDDPVWDATVFTKNRDRLQNGEVFAKFMVKLLHHPQVKPLLSDEHFSVDGTLIEAWASQKSFRPEDGSDDADGGANFHGQQRQNDAITATGKHRRSAVDRRTTRHEVYGMSQSRRAMTECIFGWGKQHGTMRKTKPRGTAAVAADFLLNLIAYNLIRIPKLVAA